MLRTEDLEPKLLAWIREHGESDGVELHRDTNVIEEAVLDSVAFLELLEQVEILTGTRVDLMQADVNALATVRGLCGYLSNGAA